MSLTAALLLVCLGAATPMSRSCAPPPPPLGEADAWLAEDKVRHGLAAYAVTAFTFAAARPIFDGDESLIVAAAAGTIAAIGKEWLDARRGGRASVRDLIWDAAGIAGALLLLRETR